MGCGRKQAMLVALLGIAQKLKLASLLVSVDDSLGKKDKATRHLEAVDFQHNYNDGTSKKPVFVNGFVYVEVHVQVGPIGFTFDMRLYLREQTGSQVESPAGGRQALAPAQQVSVDTRHAH